ncbi:hypothetical protein DOTSEDRAFT_83490 [Dothistroma septosporum NZE10]|uniref:SET domain-containing protein n=1 Tax=Dothistroma septosporum (strain NZE10 / CBS 128990) TaxID=675120 RepID=M2XH89_DOTSN|nr:hypothetical protein DOTSEDRAFT_83490 [Dothistroma septosporum NZE10]
MRYFLAATVCSKGMLTTRTRHARTNALSRPFGVQPPVFESLYITAIDLAAHVKADLSVQRRNQTVREFDWAEVKAKSFHTHKPPTRSHAAPPTSTVPSLCVSPYIAGVLAFSVQPVEAYRKRPPHFGLRVSKSRLALLGDSQTTDISPGEDMAGERTVDTRASSSESSAYSNIEVGTGAEDSGSESSDRAPTASTPPTSMSDNRSIDSSKAADDVAHTSEEAASPRRTTRARALVSYNVKELLDRQMPMAGGHVSAGGDSRNASGLSGRTLINHNANDVEDEDEYTPIGAEYMERLQKDAATLRRSPNANLPPRVQRRPSVKDRARNALSNAKSAAESVGSVLGKRGRDVVEKGKKALGMTKEEEDNAPKNRLLKELDVGPGNVWEELADLDPEDIDRLAARPAKKQKTGAFNATALQELAQPAAPTGPLQKTSDGKRVKKWQTEGLYVGQDSGFDRVHVKGAKKLQKKRPETATSADHNNIKKKPLMPLPMFSYLDKERSFTIPYDVFAPSLRKGDERPKDWQKLNRNRLVGDAKDIWQKPAKLVASACVCSAPTEEDDIGCDETCLNRVMQYECNEDNCALDAATCSNRPFAEIDRRLKKGGSFDIGVEVVKTDKRGFGIRSTRSFRPDQIIMEYTGEIISEGECQRRMREEYKDKPNYYLMELERGLVIDGTKGSMARFINHACEPNCTVKMFRVNGVARMGVFAGKSGIMTGEELTYDYNFDNFGESRQNCYCGTTNCRGYLGPKLNAAEMKKQAKEELERQRKAAEDAHNAALEQQRKKRAEVERPGGWIGWKTLDDPEVKAEMQRRRQEQEEKEKNDPRAKRLAARAKGDTAEEDKATTPKQGFAKADVPKPKKDTAKADKPKQITRETSASKQEAAKKDTTKNDDTKVEASRKASSTKKPDPKRRRTMPTFPNLPTFPSLGKDSKERQPPKPMFPGLVRGREGPRQDEQQAVRPQSSTSASNRPEPIRQEAPRHAPFLAPPAPMMRLDLARPMSAPVAPRSPFRRKKFIPSNFPKAMDDQGVAVQVAKQLALQAQAQALAEAQAPGQIPPPGQTSIPASEQTQSQAPNHIRRTSTGSRFTEDLAQEESRPNSARPPSSHSLRNSLSNGVSGIMKRTTFSVKTSIEMPRQDEMDEDDTMTESAVLVDNMTNSEGRRLGKISSVAVEDEDAMEVDESEPEEQETIQTKPNKRSSFLGSTVSSAVKSGGKALGFGGSGAKMVQSKLSFGRRA